MVTPQVADRLARSQKRWTPGELECLANSYGLMSDKSLAGRLHRTENNINGMARRKRIPRKNNFYTARTLAQVLGVPTPSTIILWKKKGWLRGKRSGKSQSKKRLWCFTESDIVSCLKEHPWLVDLKRMEPHYFRSIVQKEWDRDRWYTGPQARALLGIGKTSLYHYIRKGLLQVEKKPYTSSSYEEGIIVRDSAIQAFLKQRGAIRSFLENDPVPQKQSATSITNRVALITSGYPVQMSVNWLLKCPSCNQIVKVAARPELSGPQVRERFLIVYVNGKCMHDTICQVT